jgi:DNA repair protein RAD51
MKIHKNKRENDDKPIDNNNDPEDKYGPTGIEKLQTAGLAMTDIKKLHESGIFTIEALVRTPRKDLASIKGLSESKVDRMIQEASKQVYMGFQAASAILEQRKEIIKITTGSKQLDNILEGGLEAGSITEIYGEYRCGKTQLCLTLAVTCQLPVENGGGEGKCMYIDTEGTFRPQRIVQVAKRFGLSSQCLSNVAYARALNTDHQTQLLVMAAGLMSEARFSLIIVDSATALYRSEFSGRGELNARQIHLGRFLKGLHKLADEFGLAVVVTNQVVAANIECNTAFAGPSIKPIGGNIMSHSVTTRLSMTKSKGETRKVKVVSSPSIPEREIELQIGEGGIQDIPT